MDNYQHLQQAVEDLRVRQNQVIQCKWCKWRLEAPIGTGPRTVLRCNAPVMIYERIECRDKAVNMQCPEFVQNDDQQQA